jgi:glycosyltransferase involved in cell wall biosynthesis
MNIISLCMIVKNEEKILGRCLESVQGFVDEVILIDTGSSDNTKKIANQYNCTIIDFPWVQDFAAARNASLQHATGKWILVLDADEYLDADLATKEKLRQRLSSLTYTEPFGFVLPIINIMGDSSNNQFLRSSATRLFPNLPEIRYERPIHEQLRYKGRFLHTSELEIPFTILHTGYKQETVQEKNKSKRNMEIFQSIMDKGQKLDPYFCFTLANEHRSVKDHKKAEYYYQKAISKASPSDPWYPHCVDGLLHSLFALDKIKDVWELIQSARKSVGDFSDYHYFTGVIYKHFGFYDQALEQFNLAVQLAETRTSSKTAYFLTSPEYGNLMPYEDMAGIYQMKLQNHDAVRVLTKVLNTNSSRPNVLMRLCGLLSRQETPESIIPFVEKIYPLNQPSHILLLFHTFLLLRNVKLAAHYYRHCLERDINPPIKSMLHYALLLRDKETFERLMVQMELSDSSTELFIVFFTAARLWGIDNFLPFLERLIRNEVLKPYETLCYALLQNEKVQIDWKPSGELLAKLAIYWFDLQLYEHFDKIIGDYPNPELINQVADHFFSIQQLDLAMDYYALLIDQNNLQASGYENLAHLYLNQGHVEEALQFLEASIRQNGHKPSLIPFYCLHCKDMNKKKEMLRLFEDYFPQHKSLPFIKQLYEN